MNKFCATYRYPDDGDEGKEQHPTEELKRKCTIGEPEADQKIEHLLRNPDFFEAMRKDYSEGEPPDESSLTDSREEPSTGQTADQLATRSANRGIAPQLDVLVETGRILPRDSQEKISCLGNVGDQICLGDCSKEGSFSSGVFDGNLPPAVVCTEEKELIAPARLATFADDAGRSEEVTKMEEVGVVGMTEEDMGEDTAALGADDAEAEHTIPIEDQSTKSYDGCSEFSLDDVSEGVLDYIKKKYDRRRKWKLRGRRKDNVGKDGSKEEAPKGDVPNRGDKKEDPPNEGVANDGDANDGDANDGDANEGDANLNPLQPEENYTYTVPDKDDLDAIIRSSIKTYNCALMKRILLQGKIFITHDGVYFMSLFDSLFSKISIVRIPYESIEAVKKMSVFNFIPNALKIVVKNRSFVFTSFVHRDHAYDFIMDMVRDHRLASEIPRRGVVLYNIGEESNVEEEEEDDDEDDDDEATKEPSPKKRPHLPSEVKTSKEQQDESIVYCITPTQYDLLMNHQLDRTEEELAEERPDEEKEKYIVIQTRSEIVQPNISPKEEELLRENNFIQCNYHTDSLYINEDFKKIFFDIFSHFDDKNPFVKNVRDKNPSSLSYEHLNNLNGELQRKGHVSYESVYNISLFDDEKRVFGMPARSDVKEHLSFFFLQNVIVIQKCVVLLCSVPLAGCFRTIITLTLNNVLLEGETDNSQTPCTHIDFSYDIEFVKNTFFKYQIKSNALPELEISVNNLKRYTQEAIERRYKRGGATNGDNHTQNDHYTFVRDYVDIMTIGEEKTFQNANSTGPAETAVQLNDSTTAAWSTAKRYFKAKFNPLSQSVRHRLGKTFSATHCQSGVVPLMFIYAC
ncbi:Tubulin gamma chain [Plasmodium coatneyi]|uniref:Tubulin gamma chain n=1 Tax=Plasmodium coatneyi TaxID=208452 RepID=A0A1B1DT19_9APIC|nr:Tubulin gamma chain [Plasmodium coatneyi]ANQ05735.1 Tubulin gamma chain [Plasmodium coatneyi]